MAENCQPLSDQCAAAWEGRRCVWPVDHGGCHTWEGPARTPHDLTAEEWRAVEAARAAQAIIGGEPIAPYDIVGVGREIVRLRAENERLRESNDLGWQIVLDLLAAINPQAGKRVMETSIYREYKAALKATSRRASDEILATCPECKGEKRIDYGTADAWLNTVYEPCDTCKGTGAVPSREPEQTKET